MKKNLSRVEGLLSDLDGVWFVGERAVPGAAEALSTLRARGLRVCFITNTTTKTREQIAERMATMGLAVAPEEIINPARAAVLFLRGRGNPTVHCVVSEAVQPAFAAFAASAEPDYVVAGDIEEGWNYALMNEAFRMLVGGAELLALHKGRYWQVDEGLRLDIGAFVAGLEYASGKTATIVGKPSPTIFASALEHIGLSADQVVMVGDDIHSDVGGAQGAGITGALVRTGKFRDDLTAKSGVVPDIVVDDIGELVRSL